jgi:L-lysine exporter family protein LysE/ArgO
MVIALLAEGMLLGLGAAAPIGPVNIEIARRTLGQSAKAGVALGCGAVTVDVAYAALTSLGLTSLAVPGWLVGTLALTGMVLLTYLGVMSWVGAVRAWRAPELSSQARAGHSHYLTGLLMTLFNPLTLAFWLTVVPARFASDTSGIQAHQRSLPILCAGVFIGTIAWVLLFVGLLAVVGQTRRRAWMIGADATGGAVLLAFAARLFWHWAAPNL